MRIKHSNMINMNMMKEAIDVLINSEKHILIIGETGTGKSTLLAELLINDTDVKYFDFCDIYKRHEHLPLLKHHYLCDKNFDYFDFLSAPEKTLVLNSVAIGNNLRESKVVQFIVRFIKTARKFQLVKLTSNINNIKEIYSNDDLNCFLNNISAQKNLYTTHSGPSQAWIEHAYPLQQVTILLQGTRHSEREDIISQLEIILSRLKNGENTGFEHDDDFGYSFQYDAAAVGKSSFFDEAAGRK